MLIGMFCGAPSVQAAPPGSIEHKVAVKGGWTVSYFTGKDGKFQFARMLKTYDKHETKLRLSLSKGLLTIDASGDFSNINTKAEITPAKIYIDSPDVAHQHNAVYMEEANGEPWMSITQPTDEPGIEDGFANGKAMFIKLGKVTWKYDLTGTNAAYKAMVDAFQKHGVK